MAVQEQPVVAPVPVEQLIDEWFDVNQVAKNAARVAGIADESWRRLVPQQPGLYRFGDWEVLVDQDGVAAEPVPRVRVP